MMKSFRLRVNLQHFAQEKTEKATPKKKLDSRKKGQVAKSMEVPSSFILFFTFMFLLLFSGYMNDGIHNLFKVSLIEYIQWDLTADNLKVIFSQLIYHFMLLLAPIFIIVILLGIIGNYVQFGFLATTDPLKPKFNKMNPLEGAKRIFSIRALVEFAKSVLKLIIIAAVSYLILYHQRMNMMSLSHLPLERILQYVGTITVILGLVIGLFLIAVAILDYLYQRYDFEKNQRMSKQEVKDEFKKTEGDPLIKSKIREKQRQMAMQRMMQDLPDADVVVTNPTHYAVALKYDASTMESPQVIAKGKNYLALRIKEKAKEHGIVTMENKPLAQALYSQVEIGENVPEELFQAVAEVLAYVYRIQNTV